MSANKITKIINLIFIVIVVVFAIFFITDKMTIYQNQKIDTECNELYQKLTGLNLIDEDYNVSISPYDKTTLRVIVDIYHYEEEMQIDFEHLFDVIYEEIDIASFKELNFKAVNIDVFNFIPDEDGNGGTGYGIAEKTFELH